MLTDLISCPGCSSRYVVPRVKLAPPGRVVRCRECGHSWFEARGSVAQAPLEQAGAGGVDAASPPQPGVPSLDRVQRLFRDERGSFDPFAHRPPFQPRGRPYGRTFVLVGLLVLAAIAAYLLWRAS